MADLYKIMGVARTATPTQIKAAYRKRSKTAHPDGGGTAEKFAALEEAKRILLDPRRRAVYHQTGKVDGESIDNGHAAPVAMAFEMVNMTILNLIKQGVDPETLDIVAQATFNMKGNIEKIENELGRLPAQIEKMRSIASRFYVEGENSNFLGASMEAEASNIERSMEKRREHLKNMKGALAILKLHHFRAQRSTVNEIVMSFGVRRMTV